MAFIIFPLHFVLQILNLALWATLVVTFGLLKLIIPLSAGKQLFNTCLNFYVASFGHCSVGLIKLFNRAEWDYQINGELSQNNWYLLISNHLSYLDIILLIQFAAGRIPSPKFFLKQELIWLPFVGVAAWALEMPFMKRYSRQFIEKHPHLKGKDIETTKKHCVKFKKTPTTVINFVEGTRYTKDKAIKKPSDFNYVLPPKAGGIAFTCAAMGELFTNILNVTLCYPENRESVMMDMLCGRLKRVILHVEVTPMSDSLIGDYFNDENFRSRFQSKLNDTWQEKDQYIAGILNKES